MPKNLPFITFNIITHVSVIVLLIFGSGMDFIFTLVMYFLLQCIGSSLTFHRLICHKSWNAPTWFWYVGCFFGCLQGKGSPLAYSIYHLNHHMYSDTDKDPHCPKLQGWFKTQFQFLFPSKDIKVKNIRQLASNKFVAFCHKNYWKINITFGLIIFLIYPFGLVSCYLAPAGLSYIALGGINYRGHNNGYRNYDIDDNSTNDWLTGILTFGEGYQNNHHYDASVANFSRRWYEIDIGAVLIRLLEKRTS